MPDNIAVKKVTVADPEVAFNIHLNRSESLPKISGIDFHLTMIQKRPEGDRAFKSTMSLGRSTNDALQSLEEMTNDEFDIIFPFVDPHYGAGQSFKYELKMVLKDMEGKDCYHKIEAGEEPVTTDEKYLDYWIQDGKLEYVHSNKHFLKPEDGTFKVYDAVLGKAGMGLRVSWGDDIKPKVRKIHFTADFEDGKAKVNTWLNVDMKYIPEYLPITIFVPYPQGAKQSEGFTPSKPRIFDVILFDEQDRPIDVLIDTDIPWNTGQEGA